MYSDLPVCVLEGTLKSYDGEEEICCVWRVWFCVRCAVNVEPSSSNQTPPPDEEAPPAPVPPRLTLLGTPFTLVTPAQSFTSRSGGEAGAGAGGVWGTLACGLTGIRSWGAR